MRKVSIKEYCKKLTKLWKETNNNKNYTEEIVPDISLKNIKYLKESMVTSTTDIFWKK